MQRTSPAVGVFFAFPERHSIGLPFFCEARRGPHDAQSPQGPTLLPLLLQLPLPHRLVVLRRCHQEFPSANLLVGDPLQQDFATIGRPTSPPPHHRCKTRFTSFIICPPFNYY